MSAKYFEYYTIILRGAVFSWTHCICISCHLSDVFVCISIHVQLRRRIVATSGSNGCGISSVISLQLGYLLLANFLHHTGWSKSLSMCK